MKLARFQTLFYSVAAAFVVPVAVAAPWGPPQMGDLILGFQATGGDGSGTNVFYNLGPARNLLNNPNPSGTIVNLNAKLVAEYGTGWFSRTDLFVGAFTANSNSTSGADAVGDPRPTVYLTKASATNTAQTAPLVALSGSATLITNSLATSATRFSGMITAFNSATPPVTADGSGIATMTESGNPTAWPNSWTTRNPTSALGVQSAAFSIFADGIQQNFGKSGTVLNIDLQRYERGAASAAYVTTIKISNTGLITIVNPSPPVTLSLSTSGSGTISGATNGQSFTVGTQVPLTAVPAAGHTFTGWSGDLTGSTNPQTVGMTVNRSVTATFARDLADTDGDGISNYMESVFATNPAVANTVPALPLGFSWKSSVSTLAGAEISAFDPASKRLFVSEPTTTSPARVGGLAVVDLTSPAAPVVVSTLRFTDAPFSLSSTDVNSVACANGIVAVAISTGKTTPGKIVFLNASDLALRSSVDCGILPDMITFTPNGQKLLVANEGEYLDSNGGPGTARGTVSIIDVSTVTSPVVTEVDFTSFDGQAATLKAAGVRIFGSELPSLDLEPEYIAVSPDGATAFVTLQENNAVAILNIASASFTSVVPLGKKDFSTLLADFSDKDSATGGTTAYLRTGNPVKSLYQPDAIASFTQGGSTYYITANEGDDRNDFLNPDEKVRLSSLTLNATTFPGAATLQQDANLGRLNVTNVGSDGDAEPDTEILAYGGRSFSILNSSGALIYDSGDLIERTIASYGKGSEVTAPIFDDARSDDKGPEPEGVTVSQLGGRTLAFVGLERSNGVLVFDITNVIASPSSVSVVAFLRNTGDISPEGILTIPAADSPNGKMLAVSSNEVSNTVSIFELQQVYTLTVNPPSNGSVTGNVGSYVAGSNATVTAVPSAGYVFTGWTGAASGTANPLTVTMDGNKTIGATFTAQYTVTVTPPTNGSVTGLAAGGLYLDGTSATLTAVPATGYLFGSWGGSASGSTNPLVLPVNGNKTVTASFTPNNALGLTAFSIYQEALVAALQNRWEVGDTVDLNLGFLYLNIPSGYSIGVVNLPPGLKFNALTRKIEGTITGEMPDLPLEIRLLDAKKKVSGSPLVWDFEVAPYRLLGRYEILLENAGLPVGKASLNVTGPGNYTAKLELQGQTERSITKGTFPALTGSAPYTVTVPFPAGKAGSGVTATSVAFVINPASDLVTGSAGATPSSTSIGTARGFRLAKAGREPRLAITVALQNGLAGNRTSTPGGQGYATGSLKSGLINLTGALGDGAALSAGLNLSQTDQTVVFLQPYKGPLHAATSCIGGIVTIGNVGQPARGGSSSLPLTAGLKWRKAAVPTDKSYKLGFGPLDVSTRVDRWVGVATAPGMALSLGLANRQVYVQYQGANQPAPPAGRALPSVFSLRNGFALARVAPLNSVVSTGRTVPATGAFSGTLVLGAPAAATTFNGILLQEDEGALVGAGLIRIPTSTTGDYETAAINLLNSLAP